MPQEIKNEKKFLELSKEASECMVLRVKDYVKLKLRCTKYLYTYKTDPESSEDLLKKIRCSIIEL
ncbi:MAG: hypothetical protein EU551_03880 [Promethearchaeota archaeon]|nr:MAG: hypothetical protein EU551_03880 [Candidatus Lokiarchaeota archaeon]